MYNLADTSKQSILDLINGSNGTSYALSQVSIALPADLSGSGFDAKLQTTNTVVELTNVDDSTDKVTIGYHRIDGNDAFGSTPSVPVVLSGKTDNDIIAAVLTHISDVWGMPVETGTYSAVRTDNTVVITFNDHYVLDNTATIALTELVSLKTVITTVSTTSHFVAGDSFVGDTSAAVLLALVNSTNGSTLKLTDVTMSKPTAVGGSTPTDATTFTGVASSGYGDSVRFGYSRLNIEELSPDGVTLDSFDTFDAFTATVTADYLATKLGQLWGFPVAASELRLGSPINKGTSFTVRVTIVDSYVARSAGGVVMTSAKTAS